MFINVFTKSTKKRTATEQLRQNNVKFKIKSSLVKQQQSV